MQVGVLAFARVREVLGFSERTLDVPPRATGAAIFERLCAQTPAFEELAASTRIARNGTLVDAAAAFSEGDEAALLPPAGGG